MHILVNLTGKPGKFRGVDWWVEHNNLYLKVNLQFWHKQVLTLQTAHLRRKICQSHKGKNPERIAIDRRIQKCQSSSAKDVSNDKTHLTTFWTKNATNLQCFSSQVH